MYKSETLNHNLATIGDGALLIWWGIVIMLDPLTFGMGAIGMGLILLALNAARLLSGIPAKGRTTVIGLIALAWGLLETIFHPGLDISIAMILIILGLAVIGSLLARPELAE